MWHSPSDPSRWDLRLFHFGPPSSQDWVVRCSMVSMGVPQCPMVMDGLFQVKPIYENGWWNGVTAVTPWLRKPPKKCFAGPMVHFHGLDFCRTFSWIPEFQALPTRPTTFVSSNWCSCCLLAQCTRYVATTETLRPSPSQAPGFYHSLKLVCCMRWHVEGAFMWFRLVLECVA